MSGIATFAYFCCRANGWALCSGAVGLGQTDGTGRHARDFYVPVIVHLGAEALNLFKDLPAEGVLFPYLSRVRANDRATEFRSRCRQLGINGVTLHSYRYAWAERAKTVGYPERFAQEALGHNSKAVHRAYAKRALMKIPSLEDYEHRAA